jgi:crossover junction endodeoxyribonuclease RuvC
VILASFAPHVQSAIMRVVGIDPGLSRVGIGALSSDDGRTFYDIDWATIETPSSTSLPDRLLMISQDLEKYITDTKPELVVIERIFFAVNRASAIDIAQARGAILTTIAKHGIPIIEPTPLAIKRAITGDGQADKKQIQWMVRTMLALTETPQPFDAADALAMAMFGILSSQSLLVGAPHQSLSHRRIPKKSASR